MSGPKQLYRRIPGAGQKGNAHPTVFELRRLQQIAKKQQPWYPFAGPEEWELCEWIIKRKSGEQTPLFNREISSELILKFREADHTKYASFHDNKTFLRTVDSLPGPSADWKLVEITVEGNQVDATGKKMSEVLDLWARDPVAVVADLAGDPHFEGKSSFEPTQVVFERDGPDAPEIQFYEDIPTGEWMWRLQSLLPKGATIAPVILSSDKTHLSTFSGDKQAWPVYLTIGNISKDVRRKPSERAAVLLGYLPVAKLSCFSPTERSLQGPGTHGRQMCCADGYIHHVYPIMAAYVADYPKQCLICCCKENRCPTCLVKPTDRGELLNTLYRDPQETLAALRNPHADETFEEQGLREVPEPFWSDLPYTNVFGCITPDLLHQLHKGVFKDHFVKWSTHGNVAQTDARMARVPPYHGLRVFKKGISTVQKWTGIEYRQMEKVFVAVIASMRYLEPRIRAAARDLLDFIYLAHYPAHTTSTLEEMRSALVAFHAHKQVFVDLGIRQHFNIAKIHWLDHYIPSIVAVGSCDGFSTDIFERLHIDYAKQGYRVSNRREYLRQMVTWLTRREKVKTHQSFLRWLEGKNPANPTPAAPHFSPPDDEEDSYSDEFSSDSEDASGLDESPNGGGRSESLHDQMDVDPGPSMRATEVRVVVKLEEDETMLSEPAVLSSEDNEWRVQPEERAISGNLEYHISRTPGLGYMSGANITEMFAATRFEDALSRFLLSECPSASRNMLALLESEYAVFPQFKRTLPSLHQVNNDRFLDRVYARPAKGTQSAYYDTVLRRLACELLCTLMPSLSPHCSIEQLACSDLNTIKLLIKPSGPGPLNITIHLHSDCHHNPHILPSADLAVNRTPERESPQPIAGNDSATVKPEDDPFIALPPTPLRPPPVVDDSLIEDEASREALGGAVNWEGDRSGQRAKWVHKSPTPTRSRLLRDRLDQWATPGRQREPSPFPGIFDFGSPEHDSSPPASPCLLLGTSSRDALHMPKYSTAHSSKHDSQAGPSVVAGSRYKREPRAAHQWRSLGLFEFGSSPKHDATPEHDASPKHNPPPNRDPSPKHEPLSASPILRQDNHRTTAVHRTPKSRRQQRAQKIYQRHLLTSGPGGALKSE
ncbi:uncharacterized protein B0H18DRAFT_1127164 [Fomitopsis serialis]|uniref:uncharacterized protein n=1 Tax=Fomitopsis serialis TaxID=139415 RepID=UPI0020077546|nr:uncharacterized protein B0H18DRAFT_1127164 [Neoantrodia serialis]KAH9912446.1 hypothetical protein B0H18DRAFT_1127164 [Neoantrodia serialis]